MLTVLVVWRPCHNILLLSWYGGHPSLRGVHIPMMYLSMCPGTVHTYGVVTICGYGLVTLDEMGVVILRKHVPGIYMPPRAGGCVPED